MRIRTTKVFISNRGTVKVRNYSTTFANLPQIGEQGQYECTAKNLYRNRGHAKYHELVMPDPGYERALQAVAVHKFYKRHGVFEL